MTATFTINGLPFTVNLSTLPPDITLNTFIREHAQLTATKFMCLEGGCGVCICVIKAKHPLTGKKCTWAVNTCLTLLNTCIDYEIITIEGIGNKRHGYHPIQKQLSKLNGSQCGFCSPGFVMNMYGLLESKSGKLTMNEIENSFGGNICRCTGYRPILDAMKSFAIDSNIGTPVQCSSDIEDLSKKLCPNNAQKLCVGTCQNPLKSLLYEDGTEWHWPKSLNELFNVLKTIDDSKNYMMLSGNTAHGVYRRPNNINHFIDINRIGVLKMYTITKDKLLLGANLNLTEAMEVFSEAAKNPGFEYCNILLNHFDLIANVPVRNIGTLAGNIVIKKLYPEFPSDIFICFEALNAQVLVKDDNASEKVFTMMDFLKTPLNKTVITAFELKSYPQDKFVFKSFKIMPRAQNAHAYVNAAFLFDMDRNTGKVNTARICYGGIDIDFAHARSAEDMVRGEILFDGKVLINIFQELTQSLKPNWNLPDSSPEFRIKLACGLFYKFLLSIAPSDKIKDEYKSGAFMLKRALSSGTQTFSSNRENYPLTQPVEKLEGMIQCSGEAIYMNDTLTARNTLYCAFVSATKVGARIESIDPTNAISTPGVIAFYSAQDIPGSNTFVDPSFGYATEEIFCSNDVKYYEQPLGVVVAITADIAQKAAGKVIVMYSKFPTKKIVLSISDGLAENRDNILKVVSKSAIEDITLSDTPDISCSGFFEIGLQYHFTMEPQTTIVVPFEKGLQVWCATQWMDHTQAVIAKALKVQVNEIQLKVRRLGGAYGCKISRCNQVACAASLVCSKLNRPVRFVQTIESMMGCNGKRWGCRSEYEFHIKSNGKIVGLKNLFYEDAGCTFNENPIAFHSTVTAKNCYQFTNDNCKIEGQAIITDAPSATWCRAPGSVEGIAMIENIIEHMAFEAKLDPADVRLINIVPGNKLEKLLPQFMENTGYRVRRQQIEEFNRNNRWVKRGIGMAIMEYPVRYFGYFPATVAIYHGDGSVIISHGGIEMGQGINTKIAQVAAYVLGVPYELIKIEASDTLNGANAMVTGGAVGSESLCYAVRKACNTLNQRLQQVRAALNKKATWQEIVHNAWQKSINMIASEDYKKGDMEPYEVYGLALTEMEVDMLTGNHLIKRVDILEDAGESLSPYIDIGQIEGAYVMCLGYFLTEELIYDRQTGQLLTNRTWNYKPPGAKDIPIDFRVEIIQNNPHPAGFMRSKATGEPPCCLAVSAIFAIQHALQSAREDAGIKREWVRLGAPTTPETILLNSGTDPKLFSLQ